MLSVSSSGFRLCMASRVAALPRWVRPVPVTRRWAWSGGRGAGRSALRQDGVVVLGLRPQALGHDAVEGRALRDRDLRQGVGGGEAVDEAERVAVDERHGAGAVRAAELDEVHRGPP
jgi:hypothetical protein